MRFEIYLPYQYPDEQEALDLMNQAEQIAGLEVALRRVGTGDVRDFFAGAMPIYLLDGRLLAAGHPPPKEVLATLRRLMTEKPATRLLRDVFGDVSQEKLATLSPQLHLEEYGKGQRIYIQGEAADVMYLLRRGRVEL